MVTGCGGDSRLVGAGCLEFHGGFFFQYFGPSCKAPKRFLVGETDRPLSVGTPVTLVTVQNVKTFVFVCTTRQIFEKGAGPQGS